MNADPFWRTATATKPEGPICNCGKPQRRRRYWQQFDGGACSNCGAVYECLRGSPSPSFLIGQPNKPGWKPWKDKR